MRQGPVMTGAILLALSVALLGITRANTTGIYSGFLGCRFSDTVCQQDEVCIDDLLFGNCQKYSGERDDYQYSLSGGQLQGLEVIVRTLLEEGYTWDSLYTQCTLGNVLLAFRTDTQYDPDFCNNGGVPRDPLEEQLTESTLNLLKSYFEDYYDNVVESPRPTRGRDLGEEDVVDTELPVDYSNEVTSREKAANDEYVKVHKYLKSHKRDPGYEEFSPSSYEEVDYDSPEYNSISEDVPAAEYDDPEGEVDYRDVLKSLDPSDLALIKAYFSTSKEESLPAPPQVSDNEGWEDTASDNRGAEDYMEADASNEAIGPGEFLQEEPEEENSLSPEDAKVLGDLLEGRLGVSDLTDGQIGKFTRIVDGMLGYEEQQGQGQTGDEFTDFLNSDVHKAVKKEQMNMDVLESPQGQARVYVDREPTNKRDPSIADKGIPTLDQDPHDHSFDYPDEMPPAVLPEEEKLDLVDANFAYIETGESKNPPQDVLPALAAMLNLSPDTFSDIEEHDGVVSFRVESNPQGLNSTVIAAEALYHADDLYNKTKVYITKAGIGHGKSKVSVLDVAAVDSGPKYFVLTFVLCGVIAGGVLAVIALYIVRRHGRSKEKLQQLGNQGDGNEASKDYQDLCRQRMQSKASEKPEPLNAAAVRVGSTSEAAIRSPSSRSSTSSWSEEPVVSNMDISTGHIVLAYMEDHLKNKDRLSEEWESLCAYEAEPNATSDGSDSSNMRKNRYSDILPYDHSRVQLSTATNVSGSDYINATTITDHDPRNPAYIATQGPLPHTVADFWQMVWEQGSVVIVMLTKLTEDGVAMCHRYWPEEGSDLYHIYEVHLVSEHIWCDDYLVRSFYLKNLQTNETRTVTQFHFLTWHDLGIPTSAKSLLDFRRKVNKSYRGRSCPIVVHCSDGVGRSGTYALIDMVLNRMSKGAKEIDIAATLEHIRDQRMQMVKTKEQFEFALASVAEEVHAILKALPQ